jgi:hypothetical protein
MKHILSASQQALVAMKMRSDGSWGSWSAPDGVISAAVHRSSSYNKRGWVSNGRPRAIIDAGEPPGV